MKYVIEDHFLDGIPQTVLSGGLLARGIACHWTAGGPGRRGAMNTAQFFIDRADRNASYHEIWWWESSTRTFGVLRIVRPNRAAHSMNPNQPPAGPWDPNRRVRRILGDKWWNPNSYSYAVSFAGMPRDLEAAMQDDWFIQCAARRIREIEEQEASHGMLNEDPMFNHGEGQPSTRRDWGPDLRPAIKAVFAADVEEDPAVIAELEAKIRRLRKVRDALRLQITALMEEVERIPVLEARRDELIAKRDALKATLASASEHVDALDALLGDEEEA